jgi:geranylgeranyl diphosphate synthase type 3
MLKLCIIFHCRIGAIQDNSVLCRGIRITHSVYGVESTIIAANCLIYTALEKMLSLNHPEAVTMFTNKKMLVLHCGLALEVFCHENYLCPSVGEYLEMAKSGKSRVRCMSKF